MEAHRARINARLGEALCVVDLEDVVAMQWHYHGRLASLTLIGLSRYADGFARFVSKFF